MKVLFLDFDGVLNSVQSSVLAFRKGIKNIDILDEVACSNLQVVLESVPDLKIVVSSSWRKLYGLDKLKEYLDKHGIDSSRVIGVTPMRLSERTRGYEIQEWLDDWKEKHPEDPVEKFTIIDDDCDMVHLLPNLVQTNNNIGLTWGKAEEIIKRFGKSMEDWDPKTAKTDFPYHMLEVGRQVVDNSKLPEES